MASGSPVWWLGGSQIWKSDKPDLAPNIVTSLWDFAQIKELSELPPPGFTVTMEGDGTISRVVTQEHVTNGAFQCLLLAAFPTSLPF